MERLAERYQRPRAALPPALVVRLRIRGKLLHWSRTLALTRLMILWTDLRFLEKPVAAVHVYRE